MKANTFFTSLSFTINLAHGGYLIEVYTVLYTCTVYRHRASSQWVGLLYTYSILEPDYAIKGLDAA